MKRIKGIIILLFALGATMSAYGQTKDLIQDARKSFEAGKYQKAIDEYNDASIYANDEENLDISFKLERAKNCLEWLNRANNAFANGHYVDARSYYQKIFDSNEKDKFAEDRIKECNRKLMTYTLSVIAGILNKYQTGHFDDLIKSSTKQSVEHDWRLSVKVNDSVSKPVLSDLRNYFKAKELLEKKFNEKEINAVLPTLTRQSALSDKLKETLENYRDFTDGLKETIEKIISIDGKETVAGMGDEIQKEKFNKILAEISLYIFNYDFNFVDYPYLSDILLEIIKRKQPDADANISDLLNKIKY
jgi:tetratricopeptide (TPR) repeat protein